MKRKINPFTHANSVYIPNWLMMRKDKEISYGAKIVYGLIMQYPPSSFEQLSLNMGASLEETMEYVEELVALNLIGYFKIKNKVPLSFEFDEHEWMKWYEDYTDE